MGNILTPAFITVVAAATLLVLLGVGVAVVYSRLFKRASADEALVRTGKGGTVAVAGGGIFVIPIFHTVRRISLKQVMISITRTNRDALVTSDKIRADVHGTMYVRVGDATADIIQSAKTFGEVSAVEIERLIQDKVTDAMRAEAMNVSFLDLNVNKREFGEAIAAAVQQDLKKTGLVLDSVAVTSISQVPVNPEAIPMDVFEAEGVRNIVAVVEKNREETNRIRRDKQVEIQEVDVEARKRALLLDEAQKRAEADQTQRVAAYEAEKETEAKTAVLEQMRLAEEAAIAKDEEVRKRSIARDRELAVEQAAREEAAEVARAKAERAIETAQIEKAKAVEAASVAKQQVIETAEIDKQKAIAAAKALEAEARASQARAEAEEEEATQAIATVSETVEADRKRQVAVIKAEEEAKKQQIDADRDAYVETKQAQAERDARKARAEAQVHEARERSAAIKIDADAHVYNMKTRAEGDAKAAILQAAAITDLARAELEKGKADAEAERLLVLARNQVATHVLLRDVAIEALRQAPPTIEAFMKGLEAVDEVRVLQLSGLGTGGAANDSGGMNLPAAIGSSLAQSAGLVPVVSALLNFAKDSGLAPRAKGALREVAQSMGLSQPNGEERSVIEMEAALESALKEDEPLELEPLPVESLELEPPPTSSDEQSSAA